MADPMTQEQYISDYCHWHRITRETFDANYVAVPCSCGEKLCRGWRIAVKEREVKVRTK